LSATCFECEGDLNYDGSCSGCELDKLKPLAVALLEAVEAASEDGTILHASACKHCGQCRICNAHVAAAAKKLRELL
jgi:hypothetical protein